jgi:hypothetical protein
LPVYQAPISLFARLDSAIIGTHAAFFLYRGIIDTARAINPGGA